MTDEARATVARRLRTQARGCAALGSPLYAGLLEHAATDVEAGGVVWSVLAGHEGDPGHSALALRLLGPVHRLVLEGRAPALAAHYPSAGGRAPERPVDAWPAFRDVVEDHADDLRQAVHRRVQTNEVGRAGALVGGFLTVARDTGLPLRTLEVGASAGLNLRWDRFAYRAGALSWGDHASPVQLGDPYEGGRPPFHVAAEVAERRGCDRDPIDPTTDEGRLTLMSFAWPDMARRFADLRGALDVARAVPATVDREGAVTWLAEQLAEPRPGVATVVFHSVVMQYLSEEDRAAVDRVFEEAGARASRAAPLARLQMEPSNRAFDVRLTTWPGGHDELLAITHGHGRPVRWLVDEAG